MSTVPAAREDGFKAKRRKKRQSGGPKNGEAIKNLRERSNKAGMMKGPQKNPVGRFEGISRTLQSDKRGPVVTKVVGEAPTLRRRGKGPAKNDAQGGGKKTPMTN